MTNQKKLHRKIDEVVSVMEENGRTTYNYEDTTKKRHGQPLSDKDFLIEFFRVLKGYHEIDDPFQNTEKPDWGRWNRESSRIIKAVGRDEGLRLVFSIYQWAETNELSWTLATCIKMYPEYKQGKLRVQEIERDDVYCYTMENYPIESQQELEKLHTEGKIFFNKGIKQWQFINKETYESYTSNKHA